MSGDRGELACAVVNAVVAGGLLLGLWLLQQFRPVDYVRLINEDGYTEFTTFIAFAAAGVLLILHHRRRPRGRASLAMLAVGALLLMMAGEEVSWGQRMLGISTPELIAAINGQDELNLHNMEGIRRLPVHAVAGWLLLAGTALSLLGLPLVRWRVLPFFVVASLVLLEQPLVKSDEVGEFLMAVAVLAWAIDEARPLAARAFGHRLAAAGGLAIVSVGAALLAAQFAQPPFWLLNRTALRDFPRLGLERQAREVLDYVAVHSPPVPRIEEAVIEAVVHTQQ